MYLRLFDVDWDEVQHSAMPLAPIHLPAQMDRTFKYIPVIFIKQEVLGHFLEDNVSSLAGHIAAMGQALCEQAGIKPKEIQIDCDWTSSTRDRYFKLLEAFRQQDWFKGKTLSATIRLHQVKYKVRMGVPPVDKGLLMCYNMGNIKQYDIKNSIIDPEEAEKYLAYLPTYPLPLDVALPLFDWCLLFKDKQFKGILRDIPATLVKQGTLFNKTGSNMYACTKDTVLNGYTLKKGEEIRPEDASYNDIHELAKYTAKNIKQDSLNVVFFHCDSITLKKYSVHALEKVLDAYR